MKHLEGLQSADSINGKSLLARATGRFYTPEVVGRRLARELVSLLSIRSGEILRVVDPFCGDGRLLKWFLEALREFGSLSKCRIEVCGWDVDAKASRTATRDLTEFIAATGVRAKVSIEHVDTFTIACQRADGFDCVITNPPWEMLKPDRRELASLDKRAVEEYSAALAQYDQLLAASFPLSQPSRKFSGWGTNLSRAGLEAAARLVKRGGHVACVAPAALLTDQSSWRLRRWLLERFEWLSIAHYPAETRLFCNVDTSFVTFTSRRVEGSRFSPTFVRFDRNLKIVSENKVPLSASELQRLSFVIPAHATAGVIQAMCGWADLPALGQLQTEASSGLWLGRELDETGRRRFIQPAGSVPFVKGRLVNRYGLSSEFTEFIRPDVVTIPASAGHPRVAWRDVSRRSQRRRMQAAIVPAGLVTGNSLHVAYFRDDDLERLRSLMALLNSYCFEAQVNARLGTGHISLGIVKQTHIPCLDRDLVKRLSAAVKRLDPSFLDDTKLEVIVARAYGLDRDAFGELLSAFTMSEEHRDKLMRNVEWTEGSVQRSALPKLRIPNHISGKLSSLDLQIARSVPPGGNWKNIPKSVPSRRLEQIRESYAAGEGSRSTYYGRLHPDAPAYTINTYFSRPGNGCHLHYDYGGGQHRVLSQREAARLQSFPDDFVFCGTARSIAQQIGNAVPPLLAYQIARALPLRGQFVDLFSGAGGMSLGFKWAGWEPLVANDIDASCLETYRQNVHTSTIEGSIRDRDVFERLVESVLSRRNEGLPLAVLGGPPCQGFSTAGNRRSMEDERNTLFYRYRDVLVALRPDLYIFENVPGLLNMDDGAVFSTVRRELSIDGFAVRAWKLNAEDYGVPQRRTRIFIAGTQKGLRCVDAPEPVTQFKQRMLLFDRLPPAVTVREALEDLPPLEPAEDGSAKGYRHVASTPYQQLMRGILSPADYLERLREPPVAVSEESGAAAISSSSSHLSVRM